MVLHLAGSHEAEVIAVIHLRRFGEKLSVRIIHLRPVLGILKQWWMSEDDRDHRVAWMMTLLGWETHFADKC
jgi:hypothetical protein